MKHSSSFTLFSFIVDPNDSNTKNTIVSKVISTIESTGVKLNYKSDTIDFQCVRTIVLSPGVLVQGAIDEYLLG